MKTKLEQFGNPEQLEEQKAIEEILNRPMLYKSLMALRLEVDQSIVDHMTKIIGREIIETRNQAILKERKRVIEFVKRKVLPAPKFGNEKEDILYQRLEKLTN